MEQKQDDGNLVACQNKIHYLSKKDFADSTTFGP